MDLNKIEKCFNPINSKHHNNLYEWFINRDHIPFDISSDAHGIYYTMYQEFLKDLLEFYNKTHCRYYWIYKGILYSDEGKNEISGDSIKVDEVKIREFKLDLILN
jgi:hypothetical protein